MAISRKGKRKIIIADRPFLWWVFDEFDQTEFDGIQVKIVAEDQSLYLKYGLQQQDNSRYVVLALKNHTAKIHLLCPKFEDGDGIISSSGIKRLVAWSKIGPSEINHREIVHAYSSKTGILNQPLSNQAYSDLREQLCN